MAEVDTQGEGNTQVEEQADLPANQLLFRVANDFSLRTSSWHVRTGKTEQLGPTDVPHTLTDSSEEGMLVYSCDGRFYAVPTNQGIDIYDSDSKEKIQSIEQQGVDRVLWSPLGTYLLTYELKAVKEQVKVWSVLSAEIVRKFNMRVLVDHAWPIVRWTHDEFLMCHLTTNQVTVYSGSDCVTKLDAIVQKGVECFDLSPCDHKIATFVLGSNGAPSKVSVFDFPNCAEPKASKSFFKPNSAGLTWSPTGVGVLINAKTDVDKTNESYYGESSLHLLLADGSFSCTVPFNGNKGPVHDAQWSPHGKDFIVIQGFQPAKITLFNAQNCTPVRDFGTASRNTILFSPHGRFVCLAGFGNLAGEMDFWEKNKFKMMGSCQDMHGAKTFEWTPDGRHFITSVLWPKRRVDNGVKVWTYYGEQVFSERIDRLAQVAIRPALKDVYPNRPMSPRLNDKRIKQSIAKAQEQAKPKAYIPPHLRGKAGAAPSDIMKREVTGPRKLSQATSASSVSLFGEGADGADSGGKAEKNRKRRERQKKKKEEDAAAVAEQEKMQEVQKKEQKAAALAMQQKSQDGPTDWAKELKKLSKKLAQTDKLVALKEGGAELDESQKTKLATRASLQVDIAHAQAQL